VVDIEARPFLLIIFNSIFYPVLLNISLLGISF
jgi:hypothetical protein